MKKWMLAMPLTGVALTGALLVFVACSSDKKITNTGTGGGGSCATKPGEFPAPDCESSSNTCTATPGCAIDEAQCGSKSTCLPIGDNKGKTTLDLRIRRLTVVTPTALAQGFIQRGIVDQGISLKAKQCGELGDGAFNWLLQVDKTANTLKTGGGPPSSDPFGVGYCFANTKSLEGIQVTAVTPKITFQGNTFSTEKFPKLNVPIWVHGNPDPSQLVILPLSSVSVKGVTLSADGNCIGTFNPTALDPTCADSRDDCSKWKTAGSLGGYITLEEADKVPLADLGGKSLCVMLTASTPGSDGLHCKRDASNKIAFTGDYCSTSDSAGGCQDSFWLAATFAASAVKITDGANNPLCNGAAVVTDGGTESGAGDSGGGNDAASSDAAGD